MTHVKKIAKKEPLSDASSKVNRNVQEVFGSPRFGGIAPPRSASS